MKTTITALMLVSGLAQAQHIFTNEFEALISTRLNQIALKDPHVFAPGIGGCIDYTSFINDFYINSPFNTDSDGDGFLDLSMVLRFHTDQPSDLVSRNLNGQLMDASCPDPLFSAPCQANAIEQTDVMTQASQAGVCLQPMPGSTSGYSDPVLTTEAPCYATQPTTFTIESLGLMIPLEAYQQSARHTGGLTTDQGLHMGFVSEATAQSIVLPDSVPFLGGMTLHELLPGGSGCSVDDDRDLGPDGVTSGWWFYFNSTSDLVEVQ